MIIRHFPRPCPPEGWPDLVIHACGREIEYGEHGGPLSIKCVLRGREEHQVRGVPYSVDESTYLLLNHGQRYSSRIRSREEVETLSIFFSSDLADRALRSLVEPEDRLLDEPEMGSGRPIRFVESLYPRDPRLDARLERILGGAASDAESGIWLEEQLFALLARLFEVHADVVRSAGQLRATRPATRLEQYRRLRRARDFIDASFPRPLTLAEIARIACLSPFHLLRLFKQAFGETPHEYITRRRLDLARDLLQTTDLSVTEICQRTGYQSLGSFSRLVAQRFGRSPTRLRVGDSAP